MRSIVRTVCLLLAAALSGAALEAQTLPRTEGILIGGYLNGVTFTPDGGDVQHGPGGALLLGYGFTPSLTAYANVLGARIARDDVEGGDFNLSHVDLGVRYAWFLTPGFRPYGALALTGTSARVWDDGADHAVNGAGVTLGSGINFHFGQSASMEGGIQITLGQFGSVGEADRDVNYRSGRFQLGFAFRL